ncbi:hypothetical protein C8N24_0671 [Solirubrobacter pauli]|uniref:Excalibur calcium-binding domain-containing protein n=2 Tax=Solirubrobacter pauli TaxID=166793 RepID=A0A660L8Z6_9ACTN|nr:hypothetical protein C8N24_0671 [Solirubrobacter pauli]
MSLMTVFRQGPARALIAVALMLLTAAGAAGVASGDPHPPVATVAAVCADFPNQAAAQRAANTVDADGDGLYCESLPCPCLKPSTPSPTRTPVATATTTPPADAPQPTGCTRPSGVQSISFSKTTYPTIKRHAERAIRKGWPEILVLNRPGADARRERLLEGRPTRPGRDRDEYPPAVGRGRGAGLTEGRNPRGWKASVAHVPSAENRSHGSTLGTKLRRFCDGTKFKYVFY